MFPAAPFGTGQPPSSPNEDSNERPPASSAASTFASPCPRVLWKCAVSSTSGSRSRAAAKNSRTWTGFAIPVVSPNATSSQPAAASRWAISNTRSGGTWPSYGQPNETEITPSQRSPASSARAITRSSPASDSSTERFTFLRLCVSLAERKRLTSWKRSRSSRALSSPRSLGMSTDRATSSGGSIAPSTSRASASCGITSGRTKLVTSRRRTPVRASMSISRTLSAVGITSGSFWKPSRGPTSRTFTLSPTVRMSLSVVGCAPVSEQPVPIIGGTGSLGFGLALRWADAGLPVIIGSRSAERAEEAASKLRERLPDAEVEGLENAEAAARGDIVVLTVPFRNQSENLANLREVLREGQILVDSTVPIAAAIGGRATRILGVPQGSAAEQASEMVPDGVTVVSALHTVSGSKLGDLDWQLDEDVPIMGDHRDTKKRVADLIARIDGLR